MDTNISQAQPTKSFEGHLTLGNILDTTGVEPGQDSAPPAHLHGHGPDRARGPDAGEDP